MEKSVKELGYIVLLEPVLDDGFVDAEFQFYLDRPDEVTRKQSWYEGQFTRRGIKVCSAQRYPMPGN